jgi:hypothetical protein
MDHSQALGSHRLAPDPPAIRNCPTPAILTSDWFLFNAQSIVNKIQDLEIFVNHHNPSVVGITETWLTDDIPDTLFCPKGYYTLRQDRRSAGGGVALIIKNEISATRVYLASAYASLELICADIVINSMTYRTVVYYRPPYYTPADLVYLSNSQQCLSELSETMPNMILLGDFNLPDVDWTCYYAPNNEFYNLFLRFVNDSALQQYVLAPTRKDNILDLVFTNSISIISDLQVLCPFGSSDHSIVQFSVNLPSCTSSVTNGSSFYDFENADFVSIELYLSSINWAHEFTFVFYCEDYWSVFLTHLYHAVELYVPVKMRRTYINSNRKYPRKINKMLNRKLLLWKRWRTSRNAKHIKAYDAYTLKCKQAINFHYSNNELKLVQSNDLGKFYRFVNNKLNSKLPVSPIKDATGTLITNCTDQANIFNTYFGSVFTVDDGNKPSLARRTDPQHLISNIDFSPAKVLKILKHLKPSSSTGPDGLPNILLKKIAYSIAEPLAFIFDMSFKSHTLPSSWLHAFVIPVFKKGVTSSPSNYRPISLTCVCCRVMERVINHELMDYLLKHKLITKHQHGFLRKHSTCSNLLESVNDWSIALNNRLTTDIVYVDFQKAFDTVSHQKLISKIERYGITGDLLAWTKAFLTNRTQAVKVSECYSSNICITSGVPQGSVLGPTLFLLFINDICDIFEGLDIKFKLFADDVKLYSSFSLDHSSDLINACNQLNIWADTWQMRIALDKCFVHRLSNCDTCDAKVSPYSLNNKMLGWSTETRDLGIILDTKLTFSKHISQIVHKAHIRAKLILRSFVSRNPNILTKAFITYVRPLVEYCTPIWSPHMQYNIVNLEAVQRQFTKRIEGLAGLTYLERLKMLQLESLQVRRLKCDLITCFKIIRGDINIASDDFFVLSTYQTTRGHSLKLFKQQSRIDARKFCFANRVIYMWNQLPAAIVEANSVALFKTRLNTVDLSKYCQLRC